MRPARIAGFTLVELMIALAIAALLASLAVGGYRQYVARANRTDATAALLRIQAAQERFYLQRGFYATTAAELDAAPPEGLGIGGTESGYYDLALEADGDSRAGYRAVATPVAGGPQEDDTCQEFGIDQTGGRSATDSGGADATAKCWR